MADLYIYFTQHSSNQATQISRVSTGEQVLSVHDKHILYKDSLSNWVKGSNSACFNSSTNSLSGSS